MNLREFVKKLRSPMGTTILFLSGLVILILLLLPMLLRDDAGKLEVNRPAGGEGTFDINSNIKAVTTPPKKPAPEQKQPEKMVKTRTKRVPVRHCRPVAVPMEHSARVPGNTMASVQTLPIPGSPSLRLSTATETMPKRKPLFRNVMLLTDVL